MSEEKESGTDDKRGSISRVKGRERSESVGILNLEDLWKRKRDELDKSGGEDIFKRSKKTPRSPRAEAEAGEKELREVIKEMRDEFRSMLGGIREDFKEQGRRLSEEIEKLRKDFGEREKRWGEEREELRKEKEKVEERLRRLEEKMEEIKMGKKGDEGDKKEEVEERVRVMERRLERKEKEERRKNIVIRGLEVKEGGRRNEAEKLLEDIGVKAKVMEIRRIGGDIEKGREMVLLKLENEEQKWEVIEKKKPEGRKERITEDLSWEERRRNWKLREIAREEEREGRRAWIKAGKIRIENVWWLWDDEEGVLKDERGNRKRESRGGMEMGEEETERI